MDATPKIFAAEKVPVETSEIPSHQRTGKGEGKRGKGYRMNSHVFWSHSEVVVNQGTFVY